MIPILGCLVLAVALGVVRIAESIDKLRAAIDKPLNEALDREKDKAHSAGMELGLASCGCNEAFCQRHLAAIKGRADEMQCLLCAVLDGEKREAEAKAYERCARESKGLAGPFADSQTLIRLADTCITWAQQARDGQ